MAKQNLKKPKKKKKQEKKSQEWATKCMGCQGTCKQFATCVVVKCPLFKKKD